jgi:hypothetical protein
MWLEFEIAGLSYITTLLHQMTVTAAKDDSPNLQTVSVMILSYSVSRLNRILKAILLLNGQYSSLRFQN